ncbi:MAG: ribose 5-phosphate isomerase B [Deltaproteobacteria bacterium]|nr:ribose 5-phosphate isomerase B [Deltaproteobacteria bacterium]
MNIIIGSDHGGFELKEICRKFMETLPEFNVKDAGTFSEDSMDYPHVAHSVARAISEGEFERGILICGTGIGMSVTANRYPGIRACLCHNLFTARLSREHNDANILVMGGRVIGKGIAIEMVKLFLQTPFDGGRHEVRLNQIETH